MNNEHVEEYLGAIYRLREDPATPLPLPRLQNYLSYTLISIHEMIRKLEGESLIQYVPYRGVTLTENGELIAAALIRRHRIWERFLMDKLAIPWDITHPIAGQLEHAAPELVTERLAVLLGEPDQCPHGCAIPPKADQEETSNLRIAKNDPSGLEKRLTIAAKGDTLRVSLISPEISKNLQYLQAWGITPGTILTVIKVDESQVTIQTSTNLLEIPSDISKTIWVEPFNGEILSDLSRQHSTIED
jgi:DtxR family transcriptional regulator, Mn-dependent transcriptional regulator